MQTTQHAMYLLVPTESNERVLHPGRIVQTGNEQLALEFDKAVAPPPGSDVNLFFEQDGKFMQQGASIIAVREPEPGREIAPNSGSKTFIARQVVVFKRVGEPLSAESRGSDRVSVVTEEIFARIESDQRCQVLDISPEGFGAIAASSFRLGTIVLVHLEHASERLDGSARVQTVKPLGRNKFRCGFLVPSTEKKLRTGLQELTDTVRRMQLQRLKRSA